jgi:hypothetical protein
MEAKASDLKIQDSRAIRQLGEDEFFERYQCDRFTATSSSTCAPGCSTTRSR